MENYRFIKLLYGTIIRLRLTALCVDVYFDISMFPIQSDFIQLLRNAQINVYFRLDHKFPYEFKTLTDTIALNYFTVYKIKF